MTPAGPVPAPIFPGNQNQQELYDKGALELQKLLSEGKDKIADLLDPEKQKDPEIKDKLKELQPPEETFEGTEEPIEDKKPLNPNDCLAVLFSCLDQHKDSPLCQGPFGPAAEAAWIGICYTVYIGCWTLPGPGDYPY